MEFLALDIGSSFLKGAVLDLERLTLSHIQREPFPEPISGLPVGWFEIDPRAVFAAAECVLTRLLATTRDCRGVLFSTQMGGLLLVDRSGTPLGNYISWRDQRTVMRESEAALPSFDVMFRRLGDDGQCLLGRDVKPGYAISLLDWLNRHGRLSHSGPLTPLAIGDYIIARLCGTPPAVHRSAQCGSIAVERQAWGDAAFESLELHGLAWPRLVGLDEPVGNLTANGRVIPCYAALGDHPCALAGVLLEENELSLNISTGSQASLLTSCWLPGNYQTRPYLDGRYLNTITHLPAGRSLNVLVDLLMEVSRAAAVCGATAEAPGVSRAFDPWPYLTQAIEATNDSGLQVDLAFFAGPMGNEGSITGITVDNLTAGGLFRAALRNMADNYAECAKRLAADFSWRRLVFSGGLAQNLDFLRRLIRERLPGECRVCEETEDTLRGLLVAALVASSVDPDVSAATARLQAADANVAAARALADRT